MRQQQQHKHKKRPQQDQQYSQQRCGSRAALCCSCRLSVSSSSEEAESPAGSSSSSSSERYASVSSLAHAMVQERLDQMIKEMKENSQNRNTSTITSTNVVAERPSSSSRRQRNSSIEEGTSAYNATKFVLMVAMEKCSDDPREDFRESMVEMITANRIDEPRDLRSLLDYYVSMNSEEYHGVILEVFHEVCSHLFLYSCKGQY